MANITVLKQALLTDKITTGAGTAITGLAGYKTYSASGETSAGDGSATILIEGSMNNGASWETIGTITLTLATMTSSDGFTSTDRYENIRARVTALSGTDASVDCSVGY